MKLGNNNLKKKKNHPNQKNYQTGAYTGVDIFVYLLFCKLSLTVSERRGWNVGWFENFSWFWPARPKLETSPKCSGPAAINYPNMWLILSFTVFQYVHDKLIVWKGRKDKQLPQQNVDF